MIKHLLLILLAATAFAQTPARVEGSLDESVSPELKTQIWFEDVAGATQYNIYREFNPQGLNTSCPANFKLLASTTDNYYSDDPAPGLWQVPPTGEWRSQIWWCYQVSAVVDGVESPLSAPVAVAVADAFYITLRYQTACTGNIQVIEPFPYLSGQVNAHFFYTDASGVDHEFPVEQIYNSYGQPVPYNEEWEGKLPVVALDGTVVPWVQNGKYRAVIDTPDGGHYTKQITAPYNSDAGYYSQRLIYRVQGGPDCPQPYGLGSEYDWWQNVVKH